jgi:TonB family protein
VKRILIVAAFAAAAPAWADPAAGPTPPAQHADGKHVITNPDWLRKPSGEEFAQFYPVFGVEGWAAIECGVTAEGKMEGCVVNSEEPKGLGFGAAALKISKFFQMKPKTLDGVPVGGGTFATRIRFTMSDGASAYQAGVTLPRWLEPSPEAILKAWPPKAPDSGGAVRLRCTVTELGRAEGCTVIDETPEHSGFGAAALKLVPALRFEPAKLKGKPVRFRAEFRVPFAKPQPKQAGTQAFDDITALHNAPWQTTPTAADMAAAWPKDAPADLAEAKVRLRCGFSPDTSLTGCKLLSEDPPGHGFAEAALALSNRFRTRGALMEDRLLAQARITLSFDFINPKKGPAAPEQLTQPNWIRFIPADRMTELYPTAAADTGIKTGRGVVDCVVSATGELTGCTVGGEDPPEKGFGQAALAAIADFVVNPWTDDGRPVDGAKIRVPIRFVEDESPSQPPPESNSDAPAPAAAKSP